MTKNRLNGYNVFSPEDIGNILALNTIGLARSRFGEPILKIDISSCDHFYAVSNVLAEIPA